MSVGCKFCGDEHCMCEACKSMRGLLQELQTATSNGTGTRAEQTDMVNTGKRHRRKFSAFFILGIDIFLIMQYNLIATENNIIRKEEKCL